jgi:hypothetical protein
MDYRVRGPDKRGCQTRGRGQQREGHRTGRCSGSEHSPCSQQWDTISTGQLDPGQGARSRPSPGHVRGKRAISGDAHTHTSRKAGSPEVKGRPTGPYPYPVTVSYSAANPPKKPAVTGFSPAEAASTDLDSRRTLASTPYSTANTRFASVEAKYVVIDSSIRGGVRPIRGGLNAIHGRSPICRSNMVGNPSRGPQRPSASCFSARCDWLSWADVRADQEGVDASAYACAHGGRRTRRRRERAGAISFAEPTGHRRASAGSRASEPHARPCEEWSSRCAAVRFATPSTRSAAGGRARLRSASPTSSRTRAGSPGATPPESARGRGVAIDHTATWVPPSDGSPAQRCH